MGTDKVEHHELKPHRLTGEPFFDAPDGSVDEWSQLGRLGLDWGDHDRQDVVSHGSHLLPCYRPKRSPITPEHGCEAKKIVGDVLPRRASVEARGRASDRFEDWRVDVLSVADGVNEDSCAAGRLRRVDGLDRIVRSGVAIGQHDDHW